MEEKKQTTLTNPPTNQAKMVKIKALTAIQVKGHIHVPGSVVEVTEDEANEFCRTSEGPYAFTGTREKGDEAPRYQFKRAERYVEPAPATPEGKDSKAKAS